MRYFLIVLLVTGFAYPGLAQNNAIFGGGTNDGFDKTSFAQANNNIFSGGAGDGFDKTFFAQAGTNIFNGGAGDGWEKTGFAQAVINIFNGGTGDGWNMTGFSQPVNNIFNGGNGDGWDLTAFSQPGNNIFGGGSGDGWDNTNFSQPGNNIFSGGIGDGWASTYRPLGPLPVRILLFNATKYKETSALLEWKTTQETNSDHFDIERSSDAVFFSKIGTVGAAGNSNVELRYTFTDDNPLKGINYYRLKQVDASGRAIYTPARIVRFDGIDAASVRYYPNPTTGLLTIELPAASANEIRVINIINAKGEMLNQLKINSTAGAKMQVDLGRYAKGTYFIQLRTATLNSTEKIVLQ